VEPKPTTAITSLGPFVCPGAYTVATTVPYNDGASTLTGCCPTGYALQSFYTAQNPPSPNQCWSTIPANQIFTYISQDRAHTEDTSMYATVTTFYSTIQTVSAVPINGWNFVADADAMTKTTANVATAGKDGLAKSTSTSTTSSKASLSSGAWIAIGIGLGMLIGAWILCCLILIYVKRRRKDSDSQSCLLVQRNKMIPGNLKSSTYPESQHRLTYASTSPGSEPQTPWPQTPLPQTPLPQTSFPRTPFQQTPWPYTPGLQPHFQQSLWPSTPEPQTPKEPVMLPVRELSRRIAPRFELEHNWRGSILVGLAMSPTLMKGSDDDL